MRGTRRSRDAAPSSSHPPLPAGCAAWAPNLRATVNRCRASPGAGAPVLAAVDGSEGSIAAAGVAARLARQVAAPRGTRHVLSSWQADNGVTVELAGMAEVLLPNGKNLETAALPG